jgi:hypothetical protein
MFPFHAPYGRGTLFRGRYLDGGGREETEGMIRKKYPELRDKKS